MNILDTSFEENSFIIDGYTLEYKTDENKWCYSTHKKTNNPLYPYYVGVKNKTGVHVPINTVKGISPFDMSNPKLSDLFGLHVYNKPFGFQDMQIIPSVNNYPYYGDDENKRGLYYSYDGLVTGYVLNGVGEEDIKLTNGNKELKVYTINEDDITNSETKRVIYTPKDSDDVLPYGTYYKVETYFYGVNGTVYSPSDKTTFYYKHTENNEVTYVQISPQDVKLGEHNNEYYTDSNKNQSISSSVDGDNGKIQIYDENGMVYYIKQVDGQENESYIRIDNISDYQYAVISNENNTLHLTDGYGEDVEINLNESYDRLYPSDIILDVDNKVLKINKSEIDYYDDFKLFKKALPIEVYVTEDVYNLYDSDNKVKDLINEITVTSDEVNYKINIVVHKSTFNIDDNYNFIEYKYKLDNHTYNIINREIENNYNLNISCNDLSYSKTVDESDVENDILNNFLDVIIGEDEDIKNKNKDYKITKVEEGIEVSIVIDNTGNRNNIILDKNLTMGNFDSILETKLPPIYVYNRNSQSIYIKTTISQYKEIQLKDDKIYITLDMGLIVYIGELKLITPDDNPEYYEIELVNSQQVENNGLIYNYSVSINNENKIIEKIIDTKYFPESPNDLLSIFDDNIQGDNLLSYDDTNEYYVYDLENENENIDYVFMLCKKIYNGIIYYTYSPKICCKPIQLSIDVTENSEDLEIKKEGDIINENGFYYIKLTNEGNLSQNANTTFMCNIPVKFRKPKEVDVIYNPAASFNVKLSLLNGNEEIDCKQYSYIFLPDLKFNNSDKYVYTISSDDVRVLKSQGVDEVIINRYSIEDVNKLNSEEVEFGIINSQISIISSENPINRLSVEITQSVYKNTINSRGLLIEFNNNLNNDIDNSIKIEDYSFFHDLINVKYNQISNQNSNKININVSNNQYLSNYNFIYEKLVKNENNEYIVSDTQNISPEMLNNNNITINYDYINEKLNIYDCTGLKIINSKIE